MFFALLGVSQAATVERADIFQCMDKSTMVVKAHCMSNKIEQDSQHERFFQALSLKKITREKDAFATITYYPELHKTVVKSLEKSPQLLLAARQ